MTTDEKGHAETPKEIANALELGTYYVTETKASNGFVNTFKAVKVELKYANQTVACDQQYQRAKPRNYWGNNSDKRRQGYWR